ncbi:unnamed protein product [Choristocarpus tenellus]
MVPGEHKLPQHVGPPLAAEFGVSKYYMRGLWDNVVDQFTCGHTLDVGVATRCGRPSELTPTKMAAIHSINSDNPSSTVRQVTIKMATKGLNNSTSTINRWLDDMGAMPNRRWIKSKLKSLQEVWRMHFVCDQADQKRGVYTSMANTIHMDETWFYVMADGERVRVFPHEDDSNLPGFPTVQHKSHVPKTMIIAVNAHPDSAHGFDGKLGVWRVCVRQEQQTGQARTIKRGVCMSRIVL